MVRLARILFSLAIVALIAVAPLLYNMHVNRTYRNFRVVRRGVLYRGGQFSHDGLERIIHDHGIRTVITLRDANYPGDPPPDAELGRAEDLGVRPAEQARHGGRIEIRSRFGQRVPGHPPGGDAAPGEGGGHEAAVYEPTVSGSLPVAPSL